MRVASLLPSATELICAVGGRDELVGVSHECDFPTGVERLPVLTRTRTEFPRASGAIDRSVREVLADALAVYEIELERLREVQPNVIVTQDLCDVCAVSLTDVQHALKETGLVDTEIVSCRPTRLADVWDDVRRVGKALERAAAGEQAAAELEARATAIGRETAGIGKRPSVLTIEWIDPVMIGGTWMPELVQLAGGTALVTEPGQHAPTLTLEQLERLDPDVVLIKPCGFGLDRTEEELALLAANLPWSSWSAVADGRVFLADGNSYFNRPGPRLVESLEILSACIHPQSMQHFRSKHGDGARRITPDLRLESF
ncbi:MAG: iron complex transport system substrate-binding protein [Gammaproteobacteria bacterium]|jgi:iron complex transport system substrate-binding protein